MSETSVSPTFETDSDGIGWITFDDPDRSLNVLAEPVMRRFAETLDSARAAGREGRIKVVVIWSGKSDSFVAGADVDQIAEIEDPSEAEQKIRLGQAIFMDVETLPVPTVAAIHGVCLGGGVELALACTHRVLSDSKKTQIGLPEVLLGILPTWGGTTRLPRLVGLQAALDLLLTGKQIDTRKARRIGFAGEVFPEHLFAGMVRDFALQAPRLARGASKRQSKLMTRLLDGTLLGRKLVLRTARKRVMSRTAGQYPAPLRILDILDEHLSGPVEASLAAEARLAAELVVSPVSKNLVHVFRMREAARKGTGTAGDMAVPRDVESLGVLGAGVMGGGIAQLAAYNGVRAYMKDIRHEAITSGLQHARGLFEKAVSRRKLSRREADQLMETVTGGLDYHGLSSADLVVEAVVERMDVKRAVLRETEQSVGDACILATNTSSLSVDEMASALTRPQRFCGMHFFNPVHRMPLVEVIRGSESDERSVATVYAFALELGKIPVVVGDGPGFLVNRILGPYLNEAGFLLGDGASIKQIDAAAKQFGMPMGPLRLIDEVGIDVSAHAGVALHAGLGDRLTPSPTLVALGKTDRLGKKGGRGFYVYEDGHRKNADDAVYEELGAAVPAQRRKLQDRDIRARLVVQMINEAARALAQGIV
ncbi:MAG: 3-hydroxyacyl-CoA dehydrogenase NAD-binding domain-containing protein, partial [Gemmatimonadota bacterium]|nr:3-hydroxyacyl-CoA dehydrogenase NAD-binding domain-containing protein [Gemmatimonadota bacterium]